MSTLGTCVNWCAQHIVTTDGHIPIENGFAKGASAARPAEEQVPNGVTEGSRLSSRAEARGTSRTAEGHGNDLALSLASLDLRCEGLAIREFGAWEVRIVRGVASLIYDVNGSHQCILPWMSNLR